MNPRRVRVLKSFERAYRKLPPDLKAAVDDAIRHFIHRTAENALMVEYKRGLDCWAFRVNRGHRVFYVQFKETDGEVSDLFHVGPHDDYRTVKAKVPRR